MIRTAEKVVTRSWFSQKLIDYYQLVKFRLTMTVVFSSALAFLIASTSDSSWSWWRLIALALGGFMVTGAANALNQVLERDYDKLMRRTMDRPLATGRMTVSEGVMAAGLMSLVGITVLSLLHPLAGFFGTLAMLSYAFVYTPLKRVSPVAIPVGAIPGALPTLIGCVAADSAITPLALALFGIQFFWQFPHFWSIGWLGYEDYQKAGYKLLPGVDGVPDQQSGLQSFYFALLLLPLILWLPLNGWGGPVFAAVAVIATLYYAALGWKLYKGCDRSSALRLMFGSFFYLPLVLLTLYFDIIF